MNRTKIITDACSDVPAEWQKVYGIDIVPLTLIRNGEERQVTCDWDTYSAEEFYGALRSGAKMRLGHTAQSAFDLFDRYIGDGYDIVYIGSSAAFSDAFKTGVAAAEKYGDRAICVDARAISGGAALIVREAAVLAQAGATARETAEKARELSRHVFQAGSVDTLDYLKNSGKVTAAAAFFGNLLGIKPIIVNDGQGANVPVKKVRGRQNAIDAVFGIFKDVVCGGPYPVSEQTVYIGHADCKDTAEVVAARVRSEIQPRDVVINYIGPVVGAAAGPAAFGLYAFGKRAEERDFR